MHGNRKQVHKPASVRWFSVESAVTTIVKYFDAIIMSLENADAKKDPNAVALHRFMSTSVFLLVTALLADVLCFIRILSVIFQKDTVNLSAIRHSVHSTKDTLQAMKQGSHHVDPVLQALGNVPLPGDETSYKNVGLSENLPLRNRFTELRQSFIDNLTDKLNQSFPQDNMDILECLDVNLEPFKIF